MVIEVNLPFWQFYFYKQKRERKHIFALNEKLFFGALSFHLRRPKMAAKVKKKKLANFFTMLVYITVIMKITTKQKN